MLLEFGLATTTAQKRFMVYSSMLSMFMAGQAVSVAIMEQKMFWLRRTWKKLEVMVEDLIFGAGASMGVLS